QKQIIKEGQNQHHHHHNQTYHHQINSELRLPQIAIGIEERGDGDSPKQMGCDAMFTAALPSHAGASIGASLSSPLHAKVGVEKRG
ncbi:Hypothetical predicted protein, partial [Olea europaea subsp. europaea]